MTVNSSFKIKEILKKINKHEWSLYSLPASIEATIGGCIGNDVHGKDSFKVGNFSENIIEIEVILANKKIIKCSKEKNKEIFRSVVGGLGLIGIVTKAKIKLKKISLFYETTNHVCNNYRQIIKELYFDKEKYDYIYSWIDYYAKEKKLGRGVVIKSRAYSKYNKSYNLFVKGNLISILQGKIFSFCLKNNLMKYLNFLFFKSFVFKKKSMDSYSKIIYPLESFNIDFKNLFSPYSFYEAQIILKKDTLPESLSQFLKICQNLDLKGFMVASKIHKKNNNYLSFAENGISININQIFNEKNKDQINNKFNELYKFIIQKNHKIYLCKDFFLKKTNFHKNYKEAKHFYAIKKIYDPDDLFSSDFLNRIQN